MRGILSGLGVARVAGVALLAGAALHVSAAGAQERGAQIYAEQCARCHELPDSRAPSRETLEQMSVNRIIRTMDFGAMMSVTYMLDREDRQAVAEYLGVPGEDRDPPASAFCADRRVDLAATRDATSRETPSGPPADWNGWSPGEVNWRYQAAPGFTAADVDRLELAWAFGFAGDVNAFAPPTILGDDLFVGSAGGSIYALDAASGCIRWHFQADGPVRTAMTVAPIAVDEANDASEAGEADASGASHAVFFGDQSGSFYAVSTESGALLWRARPEPHESTKLTGSAVAYEGIVYVPVASWEESRPLNSAYECCTFRGSVVAYRIADGEQVWKSWLVTETPERTGTRPDGVASFGPSGVPTWSAPTIDTSRGLLYVTTGNNYTGQTNMSDAVVALRLGDGAIEWSRQITAGDEFNLYCRSQPDGCPGEDMDIGASAVLVKLADGRERLVVGQKSGWVYGLEPADNGRLIWQARVGEGGINGGVQWGMASDGERIYAAVSDLGRREQADRDAVDPRPSGVDPTQGGGLTALDVATGERVWFAPPPICPESAVVCSPAQPAAVTAIPGAVFAGAVDGHIRAYAADDGRVLWDFDTAREYATVNQVPARGGSIDGAGPVIAGGRLYLTSGYGRNGGMAGNVLLAFEIPTTD
jgi:polyvinyl alcohol dehydrogenase (cytochrome)